MFFMGAPYLSSKKSAPDPVKKRGTNWQYPWSLIYQTTMTLYSAPISKPLTVRSFSEDHAVDISDLESRLMHFGFVHGATIVIRKKSFFFKGPLLVEVRGRLIALTKSEADLVEVSL
jgi:Fe2+ transport system protein FeoA